MDSDQSSVDFEKSDVIGHRPETHLLFMRLLMDWRAGSSCTLYFVQLLAVRTMLLENFVVYQTVVGKMHACQSFEKWGLPAYEVGNIILAILWKNWD